jgi:hypothetical protein
MGHEGAAARAEAQPALPDHPRACFRSNSVSHARRCGSESGRILRRGYDSNAPTPVIQPTPAISPKQTLQQPSARATFIGSGRLTKPSFDKETDDESCGERLQGEMGVGLLLVADGQAVELDEPSQRSLDDPPVAPQTLGALNAAPRDAVLDATAVERLATVALLVGLVSKEPGGAFAQPVAAST